VKPAPFAYRRAESVDHALDLLAEHGDEARVLAGGQSLIPLMNMRRVKPSVVVDITRIGGLSGVQQRDRALRVGALVSQYELEQRPGLDAALTECLPYTGHYVTRHRGTVGGSIAHAEPRGELPVTLLALGGSARLRSRRGGRTVAAEELFIGAYRTGLTPEELIVETTWPLAAAGEGRAFAELAQRHGDFTLACAACSVRVEHDRITAARVAVGAVADRPLLVAEAARALEGEKPGDHAALHAGRATRQAISGYDDLHATAAYRRQLAGELVRQAVGRALERTGG
jgi:CO/xanthine dehydrogenase FAD-binding subunit